MDGFAPFDPADLNGGNIIDGTVTEIPSGTSIIPGGTALSTTGTEALATESLTTGTSLVPVGTTALTATADLTAASTAPSVGALVTTGLEGTAPVVEGELVTGGLAGGASTGGILAAAPEVLVVGGVAFSGYEIYEHYDYLTGNQPTQTPRASADPQLAQKNALISDIYKRLGISQQNSRALGDAHFELRALDAYQLQLFRDALPPTPSPDPVQMGARIFNAANTITDGYARTHLQTAINQLTHDPYTNMGVRTGAVALNNHYNGIIFGESGNEFAAEALPQAQQAYVDGIMKNADAYFAKGPHQDLRKAVALYERAANLGDHRAQYNMGTFSMTGVGGVPISNENALKWMTISYADGTGFKGAEAYAQPNQAWYKEHHLTPEQMVSAQTAAARFKPINAHQDMAGLPSLVAPKQQTSPTLHDRSPTRTRRHIHKKHLTPPVDKPANVASGTAPIVPPVPTKDQPYALDPAIAAKVDKLADQLKRDGTSTITLNSVNGTSGDVVQRAIADRLKADGYNGEVRFSDKAPDGNTLARLDVPKGTSDVAAAQPGTLPIQPGDVKPIPVNYVAPQGSQPVAFAGPTQPVIPTVADYVKFEETAATRHGLGLTKLANGSDLNKQLAAGINELSPDVQKFAKDHMLMKGMSRSAWLAKMKADAAKIAPQSTGPALTQPVLDNSTTTYTAGVDVKNKAGTKTASRFTSPSPFGSMG